MSHEGIYYSHWINEDQIHKKRIVYVKGCLCNYVVRNQSKGCKNEISMYAISTSEAVNRVYLKIGLLTWCKEQRERSNMKRNELLPLLNHSVGKSPINDFRDRQSLIKWSIILVFRINAVLVYFRTWPEAPSVLEQNIHNSSGQS